jgi:phenylacetic acid degradation operon negative regulatory protein
MGWSHDAQVEAMTSYTGADVGLPRSQHGTNSQLLLSGLLADYLFEATEGLSSASIVNLLGEFGVSPAGARTALSRISRRGLLQPQRSSRGVRYVISDAARAIHRERLGKVVQFGQAPPSWDGVWCVVAFSVEERLRSLRSRLRAALEKRGFAPMTDAIWVSPHDRSSEIAAAAAEIGVGVAILRATEVEVGASSMRPIDAFDLDRLRASYDQYLATFGPMLERADAGDIGPSEALLVRSAVLREWRALSLEDPDLPAEILPADWPREDARTTFLSLWRGLAPLALLRVRALLSERDADTAAALDVIDV